MRSSWFHLFIVYIPYRIYESYDYVCGLMTGLFAWMSPVCLVSCLFLAPPAERQRCFTKCRFVGPSSGINFSLKTLISQKVSDNCVLLISFLESCSCELGPIIIRYHFMGARRMNVCNVTVRTPTTVSST